MNGKVTRHCLAAEVNPGHFEIMWQPHPPLLFLMLLCWRAVLVHSARQFLAVPTLIKQCLIFSLMLSNFSQCWTIGPPYAVHARLLVCVHFYPKIC